MTGGIAICGTLLLLPLVLQLQLQLLMSQSAAVEGANILGVFSTSGTSHLIVYASMMRALADSGHNVTFVSTLTPKMATHENITLVLVPMSEVNAKQMKESAKLASKAKLSPLKVSYNNIVTWTSTLDSQYEFLLHPNFKNIYENPRVKFDLMILGLEFNDYQLGVAAKLNIPVILSWVSVPFCYVDDAVGNIHDPSYVPTFNVVKEPGKQALRVGWRIRNFLKWIIFNSLELYRQCQMNRKYNLAFGNDANLPSYYDMKRRISLLFYNYHSHSEGPVRPTVPQSVEIGGIQIKDKRDPLPRKLARYLDNANDGAIYFNMGTNVNMSNFNPQIAEAMFKVLSHQKLRVIWKWDNLENIPGKAINIYFNDWLPQDDILAHPNTKLFITHAGKGGVAEAQYHAVPMVALPVFADQPGNARALVSAGFGISLEVLTLTEESFAQAIREVLHNSTYRENIRKFSALYRDRPLTPRQSVVYWTNYVLRHNGAYHLQSPWLHMNFVARHNLDVYAVFLLIFIISFSLLILLVRSVIKHFCCGKKISKDKIKKN